MTDPAPLPPDTTPRDYRVLCRGCFREQHDFSEAEALVGFLRQYEGCQSCGSPTRRVWLAQVL